MSDTFAPPLLGCEEGLDRANREGFFEHAYRLLEKRAGSWVTEIVQLRNALAAEKERVADLGEQLADWRELAFRYGTETTAEKRLRTQTLHGEVAIARDLLGDDDDAIAHACANLAQKLRATAKSKIAPPTGAQP